jgi:hypothetical protein
VNDISRHFFEILASQRIRELLSFGGTAESIIVDKDTEWALVIGHILKDMSPKIIGLCILTALDKDRIHHRNHIVFHLFL